MYAVGTSVVYRKMGVCQVEDIVPSPSREKDGQSCYKLRSVFSSGSELVIYVPVDTAVFMRPLIGSGEAAGYLEMLSRLEPRGVCSKNPAEIAAHCREMLATCEIEDCLRLLKELYQKRRELAGRRKRLGQAEEQYLKIAEKLVCEEFAAALHTTPELMRERLYAAMEPGGQASA